MQLRKMNAEDSLLNTKIMEFEFKGTKEKWYLSDSKGGVKCDSVKGLLLKAWSVYNSEEVEQRIDGESWIDMRDRTAPIREEKEVETKANALLISKAPEMLEELKETVTDLKILRGNILESLKKDHQWEGMVEIVDKWISRKEQLLKKATDINILHHA